MNQILRLDIFGTLVLGKKKLMKQGIHPEQGIPGKRPSVGIFLKDTPALPFAEDVVVPSLNIDSEFFPKVIWVYRSKFPLENKFANELFLLGGQKCPADDRSPLLHP